MALPVGHDGPRAWLARGPAGLVGMLVLASAVEAFVGRHALDVLTPEDWQFAQTRSVVKKVARRSDLLCFGDSLIKLGVLPRAVESGGGLRTYNLAIVGGQAPTTYAVLRRALDGGARPSAVVVDFFPKMLARGPGENARSWVRLLDTPEMLEVGLRWRDPALLGSMAVARWLPSVRSRFGLRTWVKAAAEGSRNGLRWVAPGTIHHLARNDGAFIKARPPAFDLNTAFYARHFYPGDWSPDPVNAGYVDRFFRLAASRGLTVYWLLAPSYPGVQSEAERSGFDGRYAAFVRSTLERFPNVVVLDARHAGYGREAFVDGDHLSRDGAAALSEDLGALIRRLRAGPPPAGRWVHLPPYRPRALARSIETVEATQAALAGAGTVVR